jgi:protein SERAC1
VCLEAIHTARMRLWHKVKLHGVGQSQPRPLPGQLRGSYGSSEANDEQEQWEIVAQSSPPVIVEDIEREADTSEIETPLDSGLYGLFIFADKGENDIGIVDIIAIHGLNGHYQNTWTAFPKPGSKCNWLQDLLPKQVPNARIMSYGYNSSVQFSKSTAGIGDFAGELLEELLSYRRTAAEKARPIIFICHSLGGIVFKKVGASSIILMAVNVNGRSCKALIRARERDRYTELLKKIRGVVFFGTPHSGSGVASWADILANVLKTASLRTSTNRGLIKDLKTTSEVLEDISRSFVDRSKALKIVSFYESDTMELINCKVSKHQAM